LLERAREKEPDAWQRLVVLYDPLLRHWCRRGGVSAQDIEDVVQEVFARAYAALHSFRRSTPSDTFRGWLHGLTRHRILEHFRRVRRQIAAVGGSDAQGMILNHPDLPIEPDDEERTLCGRLYRRALEFIRGEFEARTWQMFWRSVIDNLSTAAVAAELGMAVMARRWELTAQLLLACQWLGWEPPIVHGLASAALVRARRADGSFPGFDWSAERSRALSGTARARYDLDQNYTATLAAGLAACSGALLTPLSDSDERNAA